MKKRNMRERQKGALSLQLNYFLTSMNFYNEYKENENWNFSYFKFFIGLTVGNWGNFGQVNSFFLILQTVEFLTEKKSNTYSLLVPSGYHIEIKLLV